MNKRFLFFLSAVLSLTAVGCVRLEPEDLKGPVEEEEILISKSFQASVAETRTTLDGVTVLFAKDESISIWDGLANQEFKADEAGSSVSFSGQVSPTATEFFAVSPYSKSTVFSQSGSTVTAALTLPSVQEATVGSFADGANISAAQSDSEDSFLLENVLAVAKMTLASENLDGHQIESIELKSTHSLTGDVVVTFGDILTAMAGTNTVKTVKLAHADGSALEDGVYYLTLLPNAGGQITLKFKATDGYTATKTATLKSAFEAGSIKNLGTVKGLAWEAPKYYFAPVLSVSDGTYMIVADNDGTLLAAKAVTPASGNTYGYPAPMNVTGRVNENGVIVMDDLVDAFEFSNSGTSGYTIRQLKDNKYWYQYSNYSSISISENVSENSYYSITANQDGTFTLMGANNRFLQYTTNNNGEFRALASVNGVVPTLYKLVSLDEAHVLLTTLSASSLTSHSAVLNANYSGLFPINAVNVGFYYGTSASALNESVYVNEPFTMSSGSISATIESLAENTTYYYRVTMQVWDAASNEYKEFLGEVMSFTTKSSVPSVLPAWLELPSITGDEDFVGAFYGSTIETDENRNYSYYYSYEWFASLWVAYPLNYEHTQGNASTSKWYYNPDIDKEYQINMTGSSYPTMYGQSAYSKGHQIPNADRKSNDLMNRQTYYVTNQTPQLQNGFNGSIWGSLETNIRTKLKNSTETVYVVTGPVYQTVGGNEKVTYFEANPEQSSAYPEEVPVPNYYWKAILRVKWNGDVVSDAKAIAFWFQHKAYSDDNYTNHVVSVDEIESLTGFDLFTNLPGDNNSGIEKNAEVITTWDAFWRF